MQLAGRLAATIRLSASSGEDPFAKVKNLITEMIARLQAEAQAEFTHKDYCDKEMAKTKDKKEELTAAIDLLNANLDKATSERGQLKAEIAHLQRSLVELAKMQAEMDKTRHE